MKKSPEQTDKKESNFSWMTVFVLLGIIVMTALWESGWKPHNAFIAGFILILSPPFIMTLFRMYDRKDNLYASYEQAKLLFRAQRLLKEEKQKEKKNKERKEGKVQ